MFSFARKSPALPTAEQALSGRTAKMPVPEHHVVNGHTLAALFPAGLEAAVFGLGCFWGAARVFWQLQYLAKNPMGYCGLGDTGVGCPGA